MTTWFCFKNRPSSLLTTQTTTTTLAPPAASTTAVAVATGCDRYAVLTDSVATVPATVTLHQPVASGPLVGWSPAGEASSELCGTGGIKQSQASSLQSPPLKLASSPSHGYSSLGSSVKIILHHIVIPTTASSSSSVSAASGSGYADDSIGYNFLLKYEGQPQFVLLCSH
jgi:hypothetical protein